MSDKISLGELIAVLPEVHGQHARTTRLYALLEKISAETVKNSPFARSENAREILGDFGAIELPYYAMGAVDSLDLFGLDELMIFAFYWKNRSRYRRSADIGANLGLHSVLMEKCGWHVKAYEPDPRHAAILRQNLTRNGSIGVELVEAAVSDKAGRLEFVRVLGNTTSSHLVGAKQNAYGELERFPVAVEAIGDIMPEVDFVKMDAEGQEKTIILGTTAQHWAAVDMMVEVGSEPNAEAIYGHLRRLGLNAYAQRLGWGRVASLAEMPTSYRHGSLFLTARPFGPWNQG